LFPLDVSRITELELVIYDKEVLMIFSHFKLVPKKISRKKRDASFFNVSIMSGIFFGSKNIKKKEEVSLRL
jgi:hypothetical protein